MTLLNTMSNLGSNWISTSVLYAADYLTWKSCSLSDAACHTPEEEKTCQMLGGFCRPRIDAYYIEVTFCTICGIIWLIWKYRSIIQLQNLPAKAWQVKKLPLTSVQEDNMNLTETLKKNDENNDPDFGGHTNLTFQT